MHAAELGFSYETIIAAIEEEMGANAAALFMEKAYSQTSKTPLRKALAQALHELYMKMDQKVGSLRVLLEATEEFGGIGGERADFTAPERKVVPAHERPNIIIISTDGKKLERLPVAASWQFLKRKHNAQVDIIVAHPDDIVITEDDRVFVKKGAVHTGDDLTEFPFAEPGLEVHYLFGYDDLNHSTKRRLESIPLPCDANADMINLHYFKTKQADLAIQADVPAKTILKSIVCAYDEIDAYDIEQMLKECLDESKSGKLYIQPANQTRKIASCVIEDVSDITQAASMMMLAFDTGKTKEMLVLEYFDSIAVNKDVVRNDVDDFDTLDPKTLVNDVRVLVTHDKETDSFKVGTQRIYVAREKQKMAELVPEFGTHYAKVLEDLRFMALDDFLPHCSLEGIELTDEQIEGIKQKIADYAVRTARSVYEGGNEFDCLSVDFIIGRDSDVDGLPKLLFLECATQFAGEEHWNNISFGTYREEHFKLALKRSEQYMQETNDRIAFEEKSKDSIIIGITGLDHDTVTEINTEIGGIQLFPLPVDGDREANMRILEDMAQQIGAYDIGIIEGISDHAKLKDALHGLIDSIEDKRLREYLTQPESIELVDQNLEHIKQILLKISRELNVIRSKRASELSLYEYRFNKIANIAHIRAKDMEVFRSRLAIMGGSKHVSLRAHNAAELRWVIQEHIKVMRGYSRITAKLHIRLSAEFQERLRASGINEKNISKLLEEMGIEQKELDKYAVMVSWNDTNKLDKIHADIALLSGFTKLYYEDVAIGDVRDMEISGDQEMNKLLFVKMDQGLISQQYQIMLHLLVNKREKPDVLPENVEHLQKIESNLRGVTYYEFRAIVPVDMQELQRDIERYEAILMAA